MAGPDRPGFPAVLAPEDAGEVIDGGLVANHDLVQEPAGLSQGQVHCLSQLHVRQGPQSIGLGHGRHAVSKAHRGPRARLDRRHKVAHDDVRRGAQACLRAGGTVLPVERCDAGYWDEFAVEVEA